MIRVEKVSCHIGKKTLLNGVSLSAQPGQVTVIIGANGAGKSTLLKLLSGEVAPSSGQIWLDQKSLGEYSLRELAQRRAVLTQQHTISLSFSVHELVMMGRYPYFERQPSAHDVAMADKAMLSTGIQHLSGRSFHTLSGGEQQRVHLARVIAQIQDASNGWLFLDEPTNGLDLLHQQQLMQQARTMANQGYGVICILHDLNLAAAYADQIVVLKNGNLLAAGTPANVICSENIYNAFGIHIQLIEHQTLTFPLIVNSGTIHLKN